MNITINDKEYSLQAIIDEILAFFDAIAQYVADIIGA